MANKKRLIDANAFQLEPDPWGGANGCLFLGREGGKTMKAVLAMLNRMVDNAPTVDAVEVVHGRWFPGEFEGEYTCSRCGMEYCEADPRERPYKYCPECGSKNE